LASFFALPFFLPSLYFCLFLCPSFWRNLAAGWVIFPLGCFGCVSIFLYVCLTPFWVCFLVSFHCVIFSFLLGVVSVWRSFSECLFVFFDSSAVRPGIMGATFGFLGCSVFFNVPKSKKRE